MWCEMVNSVCEGVVLMLKGYTRGCVIEMRVTLGGLRDASLELA